MSEFEKQVRENYPDIPEDVEIDDYLSEEELALEIVDFLIKKGLSKSYILQQESELDPARWDFEIKSYVGGMSIYELAEKLKAGLKEVGGWNDFVKYANGKGISAERLSSNGLVDLFKVYPYPDIKWGVLENIKKSSNPTKVGDSRVSGKAPKSSPSKTAKNSDYDSLLKDILDGDFDDTILFLFEDFIGKRWKEFDEQVRKNHPEVPEDVEIDEYLGEDVLVPEIVDFLIAKNLSGRFIKSKLSEYDPVTWKSELNSYIGDMSIDELAKKLKSGLKELETWDDFATYSRSRGDDPDKVNSRKFIELFTRYPQPK